MADLLQRSIVHEFLPRGWFYRTRSPQIVATFVPADIVDDDGRLTFTGAFSGTTVRHTSIDTGPIAASWTDNDTVTLLIGAFAGDYRSFVGLRFRSASTSQYGTFFAFTTSQFSTDYWGVATMSGDQSGDFGPTAWDNTFESIDAYRWIRFRRVSSTSLAFEVAADVGGFGVMPGEWGTIATKTIDCDWSSVSLCAGITSAGMSSGGGLTIRRFGVGAATGSGAPSITALSSSTGQHRARITVTGTGFSTLDGFYLGTKEFPVEGVTVHSDTSATITIPGTSWSDGAALIVANSAGTASFGSISRGSTVPTVRERITATFTGSALPAGWSAVTNGGGTVTVESGEAYVRTFGALDAYAELRSPLVTDMVDGDVISVRIRVSTPFRAAAALRNSTSVGDWAPGFYDQAGSWHRAAMVRIEGLPSEAETRSYNVNAAGYPAPFDGNAEVGATGVFQWLRWRRVDATKVAYEYAEDLTGSPGPWTTIGYSDARWPAFHNRWRNFDWGAGVRLAVMVADSFYEENATAIVSRAGASGGSPPPDPDPGPPPSALVPLAAPTLTAGSPTDTRITRSVPFTVASSGAAWPAGTRVQLQTRRGAAPYRATGRRIAASGRLAFVRELAPYTVDVRAIASALGRADSPASNVVTITVPALTAAPGETAMPLRCSVALYPSTSVAVTPIGGGAIPVLNARSHSDHVLRITGIILEPALGGGAVVPTTITYTLEDSTGEIDSGSATSPEAPDDWRFTLDKTLFVPSRLSMLLTLTLTAPDTSDTQLQFIIAQGVRQ